MNGNCGECERRYYCEIDPEKCDNLSEPVTMTRAYKFRVMSDEEMADLLRMFCHGMTDCEDCPFFLCGLSYEWGITRLG